jgi:hypothetical protein
MLLYPTWAATLLPMAQQQFFDNNGASLSSGTVDFYIPGTFTRKTTWQDANATVTNANPLSLDANGRALIYGFGAYRQIVKDSLGNTIWDQVTTDTTGPVNSGAISVGTNTVTLAYTPPVPVLTTGGVYSFVAGGTNTTAVTLNINGTGAKAVLKVASAGPIALAGGEIATGNIVVAVYDGVQFQLVSSAVNSFSSTVTMSAAFNEAFATVASAATTDIGAAAGNYILITGNTTITGFGTVQAGTSRTLRFASPLSITQGVNIITLNGASLAVAAGDMQTWRSEGAGAWREVGHFRSGSGLGPTLPRGYIGGFTLSNDAGSPNTVLDIAAGQAADASTQQPITLGAFTKSVSGNWVAGTGANGMGATLVVAANTWYHVCAAVIASAPDVFFDTDAACTTHQPANTNYVRRIGSFRTAPGAATILPFKQVFETFYWGTTILDMAAAASIPGASLTVSTPLGVKCRLIANTLSSAGDAYMLTSLEQPNEAPSGAVTPLGTIGQLGSAGGMPVDVYTDTSSQIRQRSAAGGTLRVATLGWVDHRGRFD